jgi:predicted methyltransferase
MKPYAWILGALAALACAGHALAGAQPETPGTGEAEREPAPVMSYLGAEWLERPERDAEQQPDKVLEAMGLRAGDHVADIGAGTGYFTRRIARITGPTGRAYAVEIQPEMLEILGELAREEGVKDYIEPVLGEDNDPKLPAGALDWILIVDTYHEFQQPQAMLKHIHDALKPDGKVAVIEYRLLGETAAHIKEDHRMSVRQVLAEWNPAGFELVDLLEFLPSQHFFIFQKRSDCGEGGA